MDDALLLARVVLAVAFVAAGVAKAADRPGTREAMGAFGFPGVVARPLAVLLPVAELSVAVALLLPASAWGGALGALGLLGAFSLAIAVSLARGRRPDCHCFGALHSAPIGAGTLVRNLALAGASALVVAAGAGDPGPSPVAWVGALSPAAQVGLAAGAGLVALFALGAWLVTGLLAQQGTILRRLEVLEAALGRPAAAQNGSEGAAAALGLPVGSPAPDFALPGLSGETLTLEALRAPGLPVVLFFTDPGCGPCNTLLPEVGRWQVEDAARITVAVVSRGSVEANRAKAADHGVARVLLQDNNEVAQAYRYGGTPSAVVINPDGRVASPVAAGADNIRVLLARTLGPTVPVAAPTLGPPDGRHRGNGHHPHPAGRSVGDPAPDLSLPDLAGERESSRRGVLRALGVALVAAIGAGHARRAEAAPPPPKCHPPCTGGKVCVKDHGRPTCQCPQGTTDCNGTCVSLNTIENCGSCGNVCTSGGECSQPVCNNGVCASLPAPDGSTCSSGTCCGGTCVRLGQPCNTGLPGICATGTTACENGSVVCKQTTFPQQERCNGLDDDCDGVVDEDFPELGTPCDCGGGSSGVFVCSPDGAGVVCQC